MTSTLGERIKKVRKNENLTQETFAKKMSVTRNMIATYELNRVIPTALFIDSLCTKFNVTKNWLQTGEGEMYGSLLDESEDENFSSLLGKLLVNENELIKDIIKNTFKLEEIDLRIVNKLIDGLIEKNNKK